MCVEFIIFVGEERKDCFEEVVYRVHLLLCHGKHNKDFPHHERCELAFELGERAAIK